MGEIWGRYREEAPAEDELDRVIDAHVRVALRAPVLVAEAAEPVLRAEGRVKVKVRARVRVRFRVRVRVTLTLEPSSPTRKRRRALQPGAGGCVGAPRRPKPALG